MVDCPKILRNHPLAPFRLDLPGPFLVPPQLRPLRPAVAGLGRRPLRATAVFAAAAVPGIRHAAVPWTPRNPWENMGKAMKSMEKMVDLGENVKMVWQFSGFFLGFDG